MNNFIQLAPLLISVFKDVSFSTKTILNMESDKEVISRLKFIGKIQKGEKINVKYMYVQPEGFVTKISRTLINQCNRHSCLVFIKNTIARSFELVSTYNSSTQECDRIMRINIIKDLKSSKQGILNLKETYKDDLKISCDFDTLIEDMDSKLKEIGEQTEQIDAV